MSLLLWTLGLLPALTGGALLLTRSERAAGAVGVGTGTIVVVLAAVAALVRPSARSAFLPGGDLSLSVDGLSALVLPTVAVVALLVLIFCTTAEREHRARLFGLLLLFEAAVVVTVTATNLVTLLLAWEVMGATSYALIGLSWQDRAPVDGGRVAFLVTRTADVGLYIAAGAALAGAGTFELDALPGASPGWRSLAALGLAVAALGKAAQLPFSFWLSRAMLGPSPVSALLHSAAMVAMGGYLLLRVEPLLAATGWAATAVAWTGAATVVVLGLVAVAATDLKQLLAASTCAQLGFVVLAAGSGAVTAGAIHLVAHAAVKSLLFLVAGIWLEGYGTRDLHRLRGALRATPVAGICFAIGLLALAGLPPLSLWVTKDAVLAGAFARSPWLYAAGLVGAVLSALYAGKALWLVLQPVSPVLPTLRRPLPELAPLVLLAIGAVLAGLLGLPVVFGRLDLGGGGGEGAGPFGLVVSAVLAVAALLLARRRPLAPLPLPALAERWFDLERLVTVSVVRPVQQLAAALSLLDQRLDAAVLTLAGSVPAAQADVASAQLDGAVGRDRGTRALAGRLARFDVAGIDGAVRSVAGASRNLGRLARRPQSGQLHTYYAEAATLLTAALLLLLIVR